MALPGYRYQFPKDHAAHPDYKTEWWYYTGHLLTEDGQRYGYELTFFRSGVELIDPPTRSAWQLKAIYPAHFAISDERRKRFVVFEKLNRNNIGAANAATDAYHVWNENWSAQLAPDQRTHLLNARQGKFGIDLALKPEKPPIIHGRQGVSQKADCRGCASHYYSLTRMAASGMITIDGKPIKVRGVSWMDHEFGSNQLTSEQTGWDWFSIQLNNNTELMLYILRREEKQNGKTIQLIDPNSSGTLVQANGQSKHLSRNDFKINATDTWRSPKTGARYPMGWTVEIPREKIQLTLKPAFQSQELLTQQSTQVAYWEGSTHVSGTAKDKPVEGEAYVEMTGYAEKFRQRI